MSHPSSISLAVEVLYVDHHDWLKGWLRRKLGDAHQAADLAHDTYVRILRGRGASEIQEPRAYLSTIAQGLVVDLFRRRALEQAYFQALASLPEPELPSQEVQALLREALVEIDAMLDGLGAKVKQTFILSQFEGLTYGEIATRLGLSLRTVKNYMAKAMEHCMLMQFGQFDGLPFS